MLTRVELRALPVDDLDVLDARLRAIDKPASSDGGVVAIFARLGVAPVDETVRREVRVERDIEEPTLAPRVDVRKPSDGFGQLPVCGDDAHAPGSLRDEHLPVRQEREPPRVLEVAGDRDEVERDVRFPLGCVGLAGERRRLPASIRWSRVYALSRDLAYRDDLDH